MSLYVAPRRDPRLGTLQRPYDPREQKYSLVKTIPVPQNIDYQKPRLRLLDFALEDPGDQETLGCCAAAASEKAACMCHKIAGVPNPERLHWNWLYWWARVNDRLIDPNSRPSTAWDTGSYVATNLKLLADAPGAPVRGSVPFWSDATWRPTRELESNPRKDYILSYRPFYPKHDGLAALLAAFDNDMPVVTSSFWPHQFSNPGGQFGVEIQSGLRVQAGMPGHATLCLGYLPDQFNPTDPWTIWDNQWNKVWTPGAKQWGAQRGIKMREGMFVMRWSTMQEFCFEAQAVSLEKVIIPEPEPEPEKPKAEYYAQEVWVPVNNHVDPWKIESLTVEIPEEGVYVQTFTQVGDDVRSRIPVYHEGFRKIERRPR